MPQKQEKIKVKRATEDPREAKMLVFISSIARSRVRVRRDTALFDDGILDSMNILDLIAFIETEFRIKISDDDITLDNFRTPGKIIDKFTNVAKKI